MKRSFLCWVCVVALGALSVVGCGEVSPTIDDDQVLSDSGGSADTDGLGGTGGTPGFERVVYEKMIPVACSNNFDVGPVEGMLQYSYELEVQTGVPVSPGKAFLVALGGSAVIPEVWLDLLQFLTPGGASKIELSGLNASVSVRSGATGPDVPLHLDESAVTPGSMRFCTFQTERACTSDEDCPVGPCREPGAYVEIPRSEDCAEDGVCAAAGKSDQCEANGFCVAGELRLPFKKRLAVFEAEESGEVLLGWNENPDEPSHPMYPEPIGPNGARWISDGLQFALECTMGHASDDGTTVSSLHDVDLISIPIAD